MSPIIKKADGLEAMNMDILMQQAVESHGKAYLEAERQIRGEGSIAINMLAQNRNHADPIARLVVEVLLSWMQGQKPEYQAALDYLRYIPQRMDRTPLGVPSPPAVANYLSAEFGYRVADLLAVRLVKEREWPQWCISSILLYLEQQKLNTTTSVLLRFIVESDSEENRGYAVEAIQAIADPELGAKIQLERQRLESRHQTLVTVLDSLAPQNDLEGEGNSSPL